MAQPLTFEAAADLFSPLREARGVVIAVSGGPDSTALLHLLAAWARVPLFAATVDHGLRAEARAEAEAVAAVSAKLGLPHAILPWTGAKPTTRLQESARAARYALLADHARATGASHLVTAHTLDDQAETILFRMARGSGPKGLAGMRRQIARGDGIEHVRPFLSLRKSRLVATCEANRWDFVADPSNGDSRFARARWRALMPALEREGLTPERLAVLAARIQRSESALDAAADTLFARLVHGAAHPTIDGARLAQEPEELFLRVIIMAFGIFAAGGPPNPVPRLQQLEVLCALIRRSIAAKTPFRRTLAGALVSLRPDGTILIGPEPPRGGSS